MLATLHISLAWKKKSFSNEIALSILNASDWVTVLCCTVAQSLSIEQQQPRPWCALKTLQMQRKTTSRWPNSKSCTELPSITSISVILHMILLLQTQAFTHSTSNICYHRNVDLGRQHWSCLHGNLNRPCRIRFSLPWEVFKCSINQMQFSYSAWMMALPEGQHPLLSQQSAVCPWRGMPAPPSMNFTPWSTSFSLSILPPKNWPDFNLHYLTKVSRITACSRWPPCQWKCSDLCSVFFLAWLIAFELDPQLQWHLQRDQLQDITLLMTTVWH